MLQQECGNDRWESELRMIDGRSAMAAIADASSDQVAKIAAALEATFNSWLEEQAGPRSMAFDTSHYFNAAVRR